LLGDALHFIVSTCCEIHDKISYKIVSINLIDLEMFVFCEELEELWVHMKYQVLEVALPFILFLQGCDRRKCH
jgi:hypothetical protein